MEARMSGVGQEVKRLREARGWIQAKLAVEAGMAPSAVNQIENGKRSPSASSLNKLALALGVEVVDLFPKAQAPLPLELDQDAGAGHDTASYEEAPQATVRASLNANDVYGPWLAFVDAHASRWEKKIASGAVNAASIEEWIDTVQDLMPVLDELNAEEVKLIPERDKVSSFGAPGAKTGVAMWRLLNLMQPMVDAGAKVESGSELEKLRQRKADMERGERARAAG
jgi:transcriptional regulator with XRE-family HTH domain